MPFERGEQSWGRKNFWQWKVWTHCEFQRHHGDLSAKGETESVKGETKSANFGKESVSSSQLCEFLARESVNSSPILAWQWWRHSVSLSLSLSLSVCISLSLSLSPKVPHAQYRKRGSASYNKSESESESESSTRMRAGPRLGLPDAARSSPNPRAWFAMLFPHAPATCIVDWFECCEDNVEHQETKRIDARGFLSFSILSG